MGQTESSDSSSTQGLSIKSSNWTPPEKCDKFVSFNTNTLAEGRFRRVHKGTWVKPVSRKGQQCVVKHLKTSFTWKPTDWDTTVKIYDEANKLAYKFNSYAETSRPISFTDVEVLRCQKTNPSSAGPRLNEYVVVEDYIPGEYTKWCDNYGFWSPGSPHSMQAFVHYGWYYTGGQKMVTDLQGVRNDDSYVLTDPAMLSLSPGHFGCTDMGPEGMALLLLKHSCNSMCRNLPKPTERDISVCLTQEELRKCKRAVASIMNSHTTYTWELEISPSSRGRLAAKLKEIANQ